MIQVLLFSNNKLLRCVVMSCKRLRICQIINETVAVLQ